MKKKKSSYSLIFEKLCYTLLELTGGSINSQISPEGLNEDEIVRPKRRRRFLFRSKYSRRSEGRYLFLLVDGYGFKRRTDLKLKDLTDHSKKEEQSTKFWQEVVEHEKLQNMRDRDVNELKTAVVGGVPGSLRGVVWQHASNSISLQGQHPSGLYKDLINSQRNRSIAIDVPRTFPKHPKFLEPDTQQALYNILTAYAAYNPKVGYVQSLNFIAALFLFHMDEEQAFWMLASYMDYYKMESFYFEGMETLQRNVAHFAKLALKCDTKLSRHFRRENVELAIFATPWFLTHFIYDLPLELAARVWDVALVMDMRYGEFVYRFGLSFLKYTNRELLKTPFEGLVEKLKILPLEEKDVEAICRLALDLDFNIETYKKELELGA